jgi:hypothetical protein
MRRLFPIFVGIILIALGAAGLLLSLVGPHFGWGFRALGLANAWRLWPGLIVGVGLGLALVPVAVWQRWAGMLFIPAVPILVTGGLLLAASLTQAWGLWRWAWPLEVLSLAAGFMLAALYAHLIWLLIPAIFIGLNGLVLQFCALTSLWSAWAVLWPVEFLAVGLTLLIVSYKARSGVVLILGLLFCGLSGAAVMGMLALVSQQWYLARLAGAGSLIGLGLIVLAGNLFGTRRPAASAA